MDSETKTKTRRSRKKTSTKTETTSTSTSLAQVAPEIPSELRNKLQDLMSELIFDAQEVGFCLAELECDKRSECKLVEKTKQLVRRIRELFELQRELSRTRARAGTGSHIYA